MHHSFYHILKELLPNCTVVIVFSAQVWSLTMIVFRGEDPGSNPHSNKNSFLL